MKIRKKAYDLRIWRQAVMSYRSFAAFTHVDFLCLLNFTRSAASHDCASSKNDVQSLYPLRALYALSHGLLVFMFALAMGSLLHPAFAQPVGQLDVNGNIIAPNAENGNGGSAAPSDIQRYCENTRNTVNEQRNEWQRNNLLTLSEEVAERIRKLELLRAELAEWIERRDAILNQVEQHVISVYQRMRPDKAAEQISILDDDIAISVLARLPARQAGAILDEMDTGRAAQLTQGLASLTQTDTGSAESAANVEFRQNGG